MQIPATQFASRGGKQCMIINAHALLPHGQFRGVDLRIRDGYITDVNEPGSIQIQRDDQVIDVAGNYLVPGFIDTHVHGARGHNVMSGQTKSLQEISRHLGQLGVTAFVGATASVGFATLAQSVSLASGLVGRDLPGAEFLGLHLEGPFLNPAHRGVHQEANLLTPTPALLNELIGAAGGHLMICTLAPELEGGLAAVEQLTRSGVIVSVGHTGADYATTGQAIAAGARRGTHIFNAMPPLHHREPGPVLALLRDERVFLEIVADGLHVDLDLLAGLFEQPAIAQRLMLVSDGTDVTGLPDGPARRWEGTEVELKSGRAFTPSGGVAGSTGSVIESVRNLVNHQVPLELALHAAATAPATSLGLVERGAIAAGKRADFAILSQDLNVTRTMVAGRTIFNTKES